MSHLTLTKDDPQLLQGPRLFLASLSLATEQDFITLNTINSLPAIALAAAFHSDGAYEPVWPEASRLKGEAPYAHSDAWDEVRCYCQQVRHTTEVYWRDGRLRLGCVYGDDYELVLRYELRPDEVARWGRAFLTHYSALGGQLTVNTQLVALHQ